jgi:hypothetical protein
MVQIPGKKLLNKVQPTRIIPGHTNMNVKRHLSASSYINDPLIFSVMFSVQILIFFCFFLGGGGGGIVYCGYFCIVL